MTEESTIWHYGLMAERWADGISETPQLPFLRAAIDRFGEPVLDLACGTGRLLIPLLQAGVDVDGCDLSQDMLNHCRRRAGEMGFQPTLIQAPMHEFESDRRYRVIFICDSFGLGASRELDRQTLAGCHGQLQRGGALILNMQMEYTTPEAWEAWQAGARAADPEPWPETPSIRQGPGGVEHHAYFRTLHVDPLEQKYAREVRLEKWIEGELVETEIRQLKGNMYLKHELQLMLEVAGFAAIEVTGDFTNQPATPASEELVFTAIKPGVDHDQ